MPVGSAKNAVFMEMQVQGSRWRKTFLQARQGCYEKVQSQGIKSSAPSNYQ